MKRFLFAALLIALFLTTVGAQSEDSKNAWQIYSPAQEEFSVELPKLPSNRSFVDNKGYLFLGFYAALFDKTYYFVHSEGINSERLFNSIKKFIETNEAQSDSKNIDGFSGVVYTFRDEDGFYNKILEIKVDRRAYLFHTLSETENNADVERFFDSIKFKDAIEKPDSQIVENPIAPENTNKIKVPAPAGAGSGNGSGSGSAATRGDGESVIVPKPAPVLPNRTSPVKILSKAPADYTDLARQYSITGSVQLRVTFSETGRIGTVTPITRLPFGLTQNAIKAAQQIRFEPAFKDGKPYGVAKIVEYRFTLY